MIDFVFLSILILFGIQGVNTILLLDLHFPQVPTKPKETKQLSKTEIDIEPNAHPQKPKYDRDNPIF